MAQHPLKDGLNPPFLPQGANTADPSNHSTYYNTASNNNNNNNMRPHPPGVGKPFTTDGDPYLSTTTSPLEGIPDHLLHPLNELYKFLNTSDQLDLEVPHLRPAFSSSIFVAILLFYLILIILGCLTNIFLLFIIMKHKLYKESMNGCVLNLVVTAIFQLAVVAPLSLYSRLLQNWLLGELGCYILPIIQDLPSHISLLSMFVANLIRYGNLLFPASSRPTTSLLIPLSWVVGLLIVLPYLPNITHYHMPADGKKFKGGQLCVVEEDARHGRMVRGTFILLVSVPVMASLYLLVRVWWVLSGMKGGGEEKEMVDGKSDNNAEKAVPETNGTNNEKHLERISSAEGGGSMKRSPAIMLNKEDASFVKKEKRTQMFLFALLIIHMAGILPLNVFKLMLPSLQLSSSISQLDMLYIILLWFSFLPPSSIPPLYFIWVAKRSGEQTLQDMFKIDDEKVTGKHEHERRMSNMKMEELHRRRASIMVQSPNGSFAGDPEFVKSPQPSNKTNHSRQNSLRVAVQHRRASIISTTQQDLLEVGNGQARSRSGSFRSHSNENLLLPSTTVAVVETSQTENTRRKSTASHYSRKGSFRSSENIEK